MAPVDRRGRRGLSLVVAVLLALCLPAEGDHYRGGTVGWRVKRIDPDDDQRAEIQIYHRIAFSNPSAVLFWCSQEKIDTGDSYAGGAMSCSRSATNGGTENCPGSNTIASARNFICTDFNEGIEWSSGVFTTDLPTSFPIGDANTYYFGYDGCCWEEDITDGDYGLRTSMVLVTRTDSMGNERINSPPVTMMFPIVRLQRGCTVDIRIPIVDVDGDFVSCRQAMDEGDSCHSLCSAGPPEAVFNPPGAEVPCTMRITVGGSRSKYGVAVVVEDRYTSGGDPLSTVPLHFVVELYGTDDTCLPFPSFVGDTPDFGEEVVVQAVGEGSSVDIVARSSTAGQTITGIVTLSPLYTEKTDLAVVEGTGSRESSITVTFTQGTDQVETKEIMCFYAVQSNGVSSDVRCLTVSYGAQADPCLPDPCRNGGICTAISADTDYMCTCLEGYEGKDCQNEDPCNSTPCQNGGTCTPLDENTRYQCDCRDDILGDNCQNVDPCISTPCENGGICVTLGENTRYQCDCHDDFLGDNCQNVDPCISTPCENGGICVTLGENTRYQCDCHDDFLGDNCQNEDPCISTPCENGGTCTAQDENTGYQCGCPDDFQGNNCQNENPCNSSPCINGGTCSPRAEHTDYACNCFEDFFGKNCDNVEPCYDTVGPCQNGATCITLPGNTDYSCTCPDGFSGGDCENEFECPSSSSFSICASECSQTSCAYSAGPPGCSNDCELGCICDENYTLEFDVCVQNDQCGCTKDGEYYPLGSTIVNDNCTESCECVATNSLTCQSFVCSDNATCQQRDNIFACVCNEGFFSDGLNCTEDEVSCRDYDDREICSGLECQMGCFSSPNYPESLYTPNTIIQYIVRYPGAGYYSLKCEELFDIEEDRDALYVGPGNPPLLTDLELDPSPPVSLFDGDDAPERLRIDDSAFWMYFITDRLEEKAGWRCCWIADDPCIDNPCLYEGKCVAKRDGSYTCVCLGGRTGDNCEIGRAVCSAHGDPHYTSFDGKRFDFQGACKYVLLKYCDEDGAEDFEIIQQNRRVPTNPRVTTTHELFISFGGFEFSLLQNKQLLINGDKYLLPLPNTVMASVVYSGNKMVLRFVNHMEVQWDGEYGVDILLPDNYTGKVCGLCGNMDSNPDNDFMTPDNIQVFDEKDFGNSWKTDINCTADDLTTGTDPCEEFEFQRFGEFVSYVNAVFLNPLDSCVRAMDPTDYVEDIHYDLCSTSPDLSSSCAGIAHYASQCQARGIRIGMWREDDFCPMKCASNSEYSHCMTACPRQCGVDRPEDFVCALPCVEGCQCDEGFVLDGNERCVQEDSCGCFSDGRYHTATDAFYNDDCTMYCSCEDQEPSCEPASCPPDSECGSLDGRTDCICFEGFVRDEDSCNEGPCFANPCNGGRCVLDSYEEDGFYCVCFRGSAGDRCKQEWGHCYAHGDPHYSSFDGTSFDYQGPCRYVLVQPCVEDSELTNFRIVQENEKVGGGPGQPAVTKAVYLELDSPYNISFALKRDKKVYVNDVLYPLPYFGVVYNIEHVGNYVILRIIDHLEIRWDGLYEVDIAVHSQYYNNTCGLCGSWNDNPDDDLGDFESQEAFGNSWHVGDDDECQSSQKPATFVCNPNPAILPLVEDICNFLYTDAFQKCEVEKVSFYRSCVFDLCATYPDMPTLCPSLGTYADLCIESGFTVGPWRGREFCPMECSENSHYSQCVPVGLGCGPSCYLEENCTNRACIEGCECDKGYVKEGENCVRRNECGCTGTYYYLELGESFGGCSEVCTCNTPTSADCVIIECHADAECQVTEGVRSCQCKEGYYGDGISCTVDPCFTGEEHCSENGACVSHGDGTFRCACRMGWTGDVCDMGTATCSGHGDPHYTSFDGRTFDYQGKCRYTLLKTVIEDYDVPFAVIAENRPAQGNNKVALTEELHIAIEETRIAFLQDGELKVNGRDTRTPAYPWPGVSIHRLGKQLVLLSNFSLEVEWDGQNTFSILLSAAYFNRTYGLCGTYDEDQSNDFTTADHEIVDDVNTFGNSWLYGDCDTEEPAGEPYDPCQENRNNFDKATQLCQIIGSLKGPFAECHSVLDPSSYGSSCIYDLCSTLPSLGALCDDIAKYADDCLAGGVTIRSWRRDDFCPFPCPEGSTYNQCILGCQATCDDIRDNSTDDTAVCSQGRCREGCQCDEGYVLSDKQCVRPDECGCRYDGAYYLLEESFYIDDCQQLCTCREGGDVDCEDARCHENAKCVEGDDGLRCVCIEPLIGDGVEECEFNPCMRTPCDNDGVCQVDGDDYYCVCSGLWFGRHCEKRYGQCISFGRQHFHTFDGNVHSFIGGCTHSITKTCDPDFSPYIDVAVETERSGSVYAVTRAVHVNVTGRIISLHRGLECRVDGVQVSLPVYLEGVEVKISGLFVVLTSDIELQVGYDGRYGVWIRVGPDFAGSLCSLCGNFDGDAENDLILNGEETTFYDIGQYYGVGCTFDTRKYGFYLSPCRFVNEGIGLGTFDFCESHFQGPFEQCAGKLSSAVKEFFGTRCRDEGCSSNLDPQFTCAHPQFLAKLCQAVGEEIEPWRSVNYCPVECPRGSQYNARASPCPATCVDISSGQLPSCREALPVEGCECLAGHVLSGADCVPIGDCGCLEDHVYYKDGEVVVSDNCERICTCQSARLMCVESSCDENAECVLREGHHGCRCSEGYSGDGSQCLSTACLSVDCENGGRCIVGREGTYSCYCQPTFGGRHCEHSVLTCLSYGNLHYVSFIGTPYDFSGACEYYLVRSCKEQEPYFEVIQETESITASPQATATTEIRIKFDDVEIELSIGRKVIVNGLEILPPYQLEGRFNITFFNDRVEVSTDFGLGVTWDGIDFARVSLSTLWFNQTCGVCGDFGGSFDQAVAASLESSRDISVFRDMNKVNPEECDSGTGLVRLDDCPEEVLASILPLCAVINSTQGPFNNCPQDIRSIVYGNCLFDGCALSPDLKYICDGFASLAKVCQLNNVAISSWRSEDFCPKECPANSEYLLCVNPCQRRCGEEQRPPNFECPYPCEEGCQCQEGYVLDSDKLCKPLDECGCFDNGLYHLEEYIREGCTEICHCADGEPDCELLACHANATCGTDDGDYGCHCDDGFVGNGQVCTDDPCDPNPCENDGTCIPSEDGASYKCICVGYWNGELCDEEVKVCSVSGHTHYDRFDGHVFDFYGNCSYILAQPCTDDGVPFQVILVNEQDDDVPRLPRTEAVHVRILDMSIVLKEEMEFELNGEEMHYPLRIPGLSIEQFGRNVRLSTDFGLNVIWNGKDFVAVTLPTSYQGTTCGICGDVNTAVDGFGEHEDANKYASVWVDNVEECQGPEEPWQPCRTRSCTLQHAVEQCSLVLSPQAACPPGWFSVEYDDFGYSCYYVREVEEGLTMKAAYLECTKQGGYLYDPAFEVQDERFRNATAEYDGTYWIGCSDYKEEGQWRCTKDSHYWNKNSQEGFWNWEEGQPDNDAPGVEEDCVIVLESNEWRDVPCTAVATQLVCQLDYRTQNLGIRAVARERCDMKGPKAPFEVCHEVVPPHPYFTGCLNDLCASLPSEDWLCSALSAYEDVCRLAGVEIGLWRSRDMCPPKCPEGASFTRCANPCPPTCADPERECPRRCEAGCECREGLVLQGDKCIPREECGCFIESLGHFLEPGRIVMNSTCTELCVCAPGGELDCRPIDCEENGTCVADWRQGYRCRCDEGFSFGFDSCQPDACADVTCYNEGTCILTASGFSCFCQKGWAGLHCEDKAATCTSTGSHHYVTFDQRAYPFNGDCIYHLAMHCGEDVKEPLFKILQKNSRNMVQNAVVSTQWLELHMHDNVVRLMRNKVVLVNGIRRNLPVDGESFDIFFSRNKVVLSTEIGLRIIWDGYGTSHIILPGDFMNRTCGLCGNYDGESENDLVTDDGKVAPHEFGNSWAYGDGECEPDNGALTYDFGNTYDEATILEASQFCSAESEALPDSCAGDIELNQCIFDVCALGDVRQSCGYAADTIATCLERGGRPEPRERLAAHCDVKCPPNSKHSFCMDPCERTCGGQVRCSSTPCQEGCECNEGFVRSGVKCVPEEECGCTDPESGVYYLNGEEFTALGCRLRCKCEKGSISCEEMQCHCQAECRPDDHGTYGCHCPQPYVGNGMECAVNPCFSNPCVNDGECVAQEDFNYACICTPEWTGLNCEIEQKICSVYGSPQHFTTFDGADYNFFGTCKYTLVADCSDLKAFKIIIKNEPVEGKPGLTKVKDVYIQVGDLYIGLHQGKKISFNGERRYPPFNFHDVLLVQSGTHLLLRAPYFISIRWDGYSDLDVVVAAPVDERIKLCGLCGNADGDASNILEETAHGERVSNTVDFGNSWALGLEECQDFGSDLASACNGAFELTAARQLCNVIRDEEGPFGECLKELNPDRFFENCVFAACASDNLEDRSVICRSLHTFESECLDRDLDVGPWRTPEFCEPDCPYGSEFRRSGPVCAKTCVEAITDERIPCPFYHQAGCQCAPGHLQSGDKCVPREKCGCVAFNRYYPLYEVFVTPDCASECTCLPGGQLDCRERRCHKDTYCGVKDGRHDCHCKKGYEEDGCGGCKDNPCYLQPCQNGASCSVIEAGDYFCHCSFEFAGKNCGEALSRCSISGDHHYETFDGTRYRFNGECEYVLVHNCFDEKSPNFTVTQVMERSKSDPGVIFTSKLVIYAEGDNGYVLEARQDRILLINGVRLVPPVILPWSEIHISGAWMVLRDHNIGLVIRWDGDRNVELFLRGHTAQTCGLCGYLDNDPSNDFLKQFTGDVVSDAVEFANSWKLHDDCEDAASVPNPCTEDSEAVADNACNIIRNSVGTLGGCHDVVDFQPYYDKCIYDVCKTLPSTSPRCGHIRDYVQQCINKGVEIGPQWREERDCFLDCPDNSHYSSCIGSCPASCLGEALFQDARKCFRYCNDGCECDEGYILIDDECVPREECGCIANDDAYGFSVIPLVLPPDFVFLNKLCTSRCVCGGDGNIACEEVSCHANAQCLNVEGVHQCVCDGDLLGDGLECAVSPCVSDPCRNGGTCREYGTTNFYCVCTLGWSGPICAIESQYCLAYGDPHYLTFDGAHYDFMGECAYNLLSVNCAATPFIVVIQENERLEGTVYTVMKELRILGGAGTEIKLVPKEGAWINGVPQVPPLDIFEMQIRLIGNSIVFRILDLFDIIWNGEYNVDIRIPKEDRPGICGLCGNGDGVVQDEFSDSDDSTDDTAVTFGNRQLFGSTPCDQATGQPNPCTFDTEAADRACRPLDASDENYPFHNCTLVATAFYQACRYDVCTVPSAAVTRPLACGTIATFAQLCRELGADIDEWRIGNVCPPDCPGNSHYSQCVEPCQPACRMPDIADQACPFHCAEGCACDEGYYQEGDRCVRPSECGCLYQSGERYLKLSDYYFTDECSMKCTCSEASGDVECVEAVCHENATCTPEDGVQRCVCDEGFVGDGENCAFEECADSPCAAGECLRRLGGDPNYVCECPDSNLVGHNCDIAAEYDERYACYGADCNGDVLSSPSYPDLYPNSHSGFYQVWVPTARYIRVTFDPVFEIEEGRDALYVGPGFQYPLGLSDGPLPTVPGVRYHLDGYQSPGPIIIEGDAVWMFFQTDDQTTYRGWQATLEGVYEPLPDSPSCWDGTQTRLGGTEWAYGKCDNCTCTGDEFISCTLMASQPISCEVHSDCPASSDCITAQQIPLCANDACDEGLYCDVGTIYGDCSDNPNCAVLTVTADLADINPNVTISDICSILITAAETVSPEECFTFECGVRLDGSRKKRSAEDRTLVLDIFLASGSPSVSPTPSPDGMMPVDSLAYSLYGALSRSMSDGSLPLNITSVVYLGQQPVTVAPPVTRPTEKVTVKKATLQPVESVKPMSTVVIIIVGSCLLLASSVAIMAAWSRRHGHTSSKKTVTFQGSTGEEAHTNEVFEMADHRPSFSRAIPLDDGTGNQGNVFGVKYDLET